MATERIISPGIITPETDTSFIPAEQQTFGMAVVGPTIKGKAFVPTVVSSRNEYDIVFGNDNFKESYVSYTAKYYLRNSPNVVIVRVLGDGGYSFTNSNRITALVSSGSILSVITPSKNAAASTLSLNNTQFVSGSAHPITASLSVNFTGSGFANRTYTFGLRSTSNQNIFKVLGSSPENSLVSVSNDTPTYNTNVYAPMVFQEFVDTLVSSSVVTIATSSGTITYGDYSSAHTPWITSQLIGGNSEDLFRFHTISDGTSTNKDIKVGITNLREFANDYASFDVVVRAFNDTDSRNTILEIFRNVNLNPDSPNYISRIIGDKNIFYNPNTKLIESTGTYNNVSNYIRVEVSPKVDSLAIPVTLSPRGFRKYTQTIAGFTGNNLPPVVYKTSQDLLGTYSNRAYLGFDFTSYDNMNYLNPVPNEAVVAVGNDFNVGNYNGHPSAPFTGSLANMVDITGVNGPLPSQVQFAVGFQGGFDGMSPLKPKFYGAGIESNNLHGFDLSSVNTGGTQAYVKAFDVLSNTDEYDINMITAPGLNLEKHPFLVNYMITTAEDREDTFAVVDITSANANVLTATQQTTSVDSSYAACYYPWLSILDTTSNKPIWVPPSVIVPGVIAYSDSRSAEWFAPAGLNRGTANVLDVKVKLNKPMRDILYENNINPIASFPGQGISVWGQKTMQQADSALDRINVRRLLINIKKFVISTSRFLLFDNNTAALRNSFISVVTPYLESIQQRQGLFAFEIIMDETNNTPDVIDRNQLVGEIRLQPAKSVEFIVINFNIQRTGVTLS